MASDTSIVNRRSPAAVAAGFVVFGIVEASWSSRIPLIRQQLGLSDLGLSVALTGPALGLIVATLVAPVIHRRTSSGRMAARAVGAGAAGLVLPALAWNLASLTVALALWGSALGILDISMNAQGLALERRLGRSVLSRLHASYSASVLAFAPLGGLANHLGVDPLEHFAAVAALCIVLVQPLRGAMLPDAAPGGGYGRGSESSAPGPVGIGARQQLLMLATIGFCALVAEGSVGNWSGVLLHRDDHASLAIAPLALTTFSAGMTFGRWRGDRLIGRLGYRAAARGAALLAAAGMLVGAGTPWLATALAGYAILGLGLAILVPIVFAVAGRIHGVAPVRAMSRVTTITYGGLFIGPPLVGLVASAATLRIALYGVAGLIVVAAVVAHRALDAEV
jgi:MFS family permease